MLFKWDQEQEMERQYMIGNMNDMILMQKYEGQLKVVAYFSKRTTEIESKCHSYELETLAIIQALKHFRTYLLGVNSH